MVRPVQGLPGGAQEDSVTTSPIAVNLSALRGRTVLIWSDDQALWLGWAATADSPTLTVSGDSAASLTSTKADRIAQGAKVPRLVDNRYPFLIVRTVSGSGTVHVKLASDADGCDVSSEASSGGAGSSVTVSDGGGSLTVDSPQLPAALGQGTVAESLKVVLATPTVTDNATYIVNGDMSADINGPSITVGKEGRLRAEISWAATGTAIGTISLQHLMLDGATWIDVPGASEQFTSQPNNNAVTLSCYWRELQAYTTVRIKYTRTSGGTANTSFQVDTRVL